MVPTSFASRPWSRRRRWTYRLAVPAAALLLFAVFALLWRWGPPLLYFDALRLLGFEPFRFPFLDIHAVLAAAQCQRQGIDVYLSNPCDALGRPHVYSPLWLPLVPAFLNTGMTMPVGLGLDLLFILSLAVVFRPTSGGELLLLLLTALSPMTIYAVERANNDLVVFLLILAGCALDRSRHPWRLGCYAFYLSAGLLKYYPLVLLALLARERRRDAVAAAALAASTLLVFVACYHGALAKALANIPAPSFYADSFSVLNLPFGLARAVLGPGRHTTAGCLLLAIVAAIAAARTRRTLFLLDRGAVAATLCETRLLIVGALLLSACFFGGQNVDYRGIYFVLVMPGLIGLYRMADDPTRRKLLARMIAAVLFVSWEEFFRHTIHAADAATIPSEGVRLRVEFLVWVGRELVWWWLVAGFAAIVLAFLLRTPLVIEARAALRRLPSLRRA